DILRAFCVCGTMSSVAGSLSSYWFIPASKAIHTNISSFPISFWAWTLITLPVSLAASTFCSLLVYFFTLYEHSDVSAESQNAICCYAKLKLRTLKAPCKQLELLVLLPCLGYSGILLLGRSISTQDLDTCFLGILVLLASTVSSSAPKLDKQQPSSPSSFDEEVSIDFKPPDFYPIVTRLPWGVIVSYGAATLLSRVAEDQQLAVLAFRNKFWNSQSDLVKQVLLTICASLMAEFMSGTTLSNVILPIVIEIASGTQHSALYYGLPVAVGASVNTIFPVSLPLVMLHDMVPISPVQLILTGIFVKTVVVASILLSTNTTGSLFFSWVKP
ncbi:unnamed protein product, partial [Ixodes hexagonus]